MIGLADEMEQESQTNTSISVQESADTSREALSDINASVHEGDVSTLNTPTDSSAAPFHGGRQRLTARGKPSYLFSVSKRPRRNVVNRNISSSQLEVIGEEREMAADRNNLNRKHDDGGGHDPIRAPKVAFALFLFVCSMRGYHGVNDYRNSRNAVAGTVMGNKWESGEAPSSFRGSLNNDHRGAALEFTEDDVEPENIEKVQIVVFDETIDVPGQLANLADVFHAPYNPSYNKLFFWHIPRSGATTIKRIASHCMGLSIASEAGKSEVERGGVELGSPEDVLRIVEGLDGMHFANVDMSSSDGIARAKNLNVGTSEVVDLVSSSYLYDAAGIFEPDHQGFMVAMFRHPIDRAISLYYNMKKNPAYKKMVGNLGTVDQYSRSSLVENNWMTRFLSNTPSGPLTPQHEAIAKEVLRTKCLVGLLHEKTETMRRLESLFNWKAEQSQRRIDCEEKLLYWDWPGKNRHDPVFEGSEVWNRLHFQNTFDIRLYEYAEKLFVAQGKLFDIIPS